MRSLRMLAIAILTGCAIATLAAAPAAARPSPGPSASAGFAERQKELLARIDGRITALADLDAAIRTAEHLTDAHRTALTALVSTNRTGLKTLRATVAAATTPDGLKTAMENMVNNHRVYTLAGPQIRLTIAIDLETTAADTLTTAADTLSALIATAEQSGKDTSKAKAKLADLRTAVEQARSSIAGRADTLLAIRPSSDAKPLKTELNEVRSAVNSAKTKLKVANADAKSIRAMIK